MPSISNWTPDQLDDQTGKTFLITGGNSGIGLEAARLLAGKGGEIILACRNPDKAQAAAEAINALGPAPVNTLALDLASLASIRTAAEQLRMQGVMLDALINNAGIMQTPERKTEDGFELQLGTNHLGHFLLTKQLFSQIKPNGRIVSVSSIAHRFGRMNLDDLMFAKGGYTPTKAYAQSKLANMLFIRELDRRLKAAGDGRAAICCHPGYAATHLQSTGPTGFLNGLYKLTNALIAQPAEKGAWPTVLSAADPRAVSGGYYGPTGIMDAAGPVGDSAVAPHGKDMTVAGQLWALSEDLVGETFDI